MQSDHLQPPSYRFAAITCVLLALTACAFWAVRLLGGGPPDTANSSDESTNSATSPGQALSPMDGQEVERAAVDSAVELLVAAARTEVSQKRMFALEEPAGFDIQKYSSDHQLTCYLSTPSGVWLVVVSESDYPDVINAWRRITAVGGPSSFALDERTLVTTLQVAQAQAADILLVPYPLGIPAVAYAFELQPTSDQPICAQVAGENWLHTDPGGLGPVQKAWSYRAIVSQAESPSDWSLSLGEGRLPDQWVIQFTVQR